MKIRAARSFVLLCVLAASSYVDSQEPPKHDKPAHPKLGLVLEGGGALGLAHIGVITWMEEHRIPVSYVAGTSMGGLVGGMYATGLSPAQVRELINGINWDEVLAGVTPFRDLSFRRKQDARDFRANLNLDCVAACSFLQGSIQVRKLILSSIMSRFHIQRSPVSTIFRFLLPVWPPILSLAKHTSSETVLLHSP